MHKMKLEKFFPMFLCFVLFLVPLANAADKGQIINVNQNYRVAFTDLGNRYLKQGDIVKVVISDGEYIYLQVIEASAILSKLGVSQKDNFKTNLVDFQRVAIGNSVVVLSDTVSDKVKVSEPVSDTISKVDPEIPKQNELQEKQIQGYVQQLEEFKAQTIRLQQENESLKAQLAQATSSENNCPQDMISKLKPKLDKMNQILSED